MRGLAILILIVVFFWLIWPVIARWLKRKAMERAENYMRSAMGMPPRDQKRKSSDDYNRRSSNRGFYGQRRRNPFESNKTKDEPLIPKEYAQDVEYVETKSYSSRDFTIHSENKTVNYHESQISDVEWTEIKESHSKK